LISITNGIAQNKVSLNLRDGSELNGYGKINYKDEIIFRKSLDAEKTKYNYKTVKSIIVYSSDSTQGRSEYKIIKGSASTNIKLLGVVSIGKVNLYQESIASRLPMNSGFGNTTYTTLKYYLSKGDSDETIPLREGNTYSKKFKRIANEYFSDCPELINKIRLKKFKRYGIESVVGFYNNNCHR